jgi:hypothetical protein
MNQVIKQVPLKGLVITNRNRIKALFEGGFCFIQSKSHLDLVKKDKTIQVQETKIPGENGQPARIYYDPVLDLDAVEWVEPTPEPELSDSVIH